MSIALSIVDHALSLSGFVLCMMLIVEYFHSSSRATFLKILRSEGIVCYLLAALIATIPGCFGCFLVVTCYIHGLISFGVLVTASVVTIGDVAFVLIARDPDLYLKLLFLIFPIGLVGGFLIDRIGIFNQFAVGCDQLIYHENEDGERLKSSLFLNLVKPSATRAILLFCYLAFCLALLGGKIGHLPLMPVVSIFLSLLGICVLYVLLRASDHFIEEHFLGHILKRHFPRLFLWSVLAFTVVAVVQQNPSLELFIQDRQWIVIVLAILLGFIPDSGPHLLFFTLYWTGQIELTVLLVSCIVQDGHGLVPLLASSKADFLRVKMINMIVAFLVAILMVNFHLVF